MKNAYEILVESFKNEEAKGSVTMPDGSTPIELDDDSLLNFIVFGDPQVSSVAPKRAVRLKAACTDISNMKKPLDALVFAGDVAEFGRWAEYRLAADIINSASNRFNNFLAASGNHDIRIRSYKSQLVKFNRFLNSINGGISGDTEHYYFSREINGFKFILMGADTNSFEGSYIGSKQLAWLESELSENDKTNKPVFIINHQTLKRHNGLPETWLGRGKWRGSIGNESDKVKSIFEKHKNIVFITGHLHWCFNKFSYEDYGAYKAVSVPAIAPECHGSFPHPCQSYVFSVYDDKIVVKGRLFDEGKYADSSLDGAYFEIKL